MKISDTRSLNIIKTSDGSCTLFNKTIEETYHSVNGAITESNHVFIKHGLLKNCVNKDDIHILEVGLGTGLNALLTLENLPEGKTLFYTAIEPYPIELEIAETYFRSFQNMPKRLDLIAKLIEPENDQFSEISDSFFYRCSKLPLQVFSNTALTNAYSGISKPFNGFDIIYYDAFAPQKQPEMWTLATIKIAADLLALNGIITSYCAQGQFKRHLKALDLIVEAVPGPPGKREMTIARKYI